jgi:hypothetical protein
MIGLNEPGLRAHAARLGGARRTVRSDRTWALQQHVELANQVTERLRRRVVWGSLQTESDADLRELGIENS